LNKRIIGVDVDLTVCPSDKAWWEQLKKTSCAFPKTSLELLSMNGEVDYDLSNYFVAPKDRYAYWRELDYNQFQPIEGSVEKLKALSKYFSIVFISACKGNHHRSKVYWLKEHFPFMTGFMATKEKFLMNSSVVAMIDDRLDNLQGFDQHKRILYKTPYKQSVDVRVDSVIESWDSFSVKEFCDNYLE